MSQTFLDILRSRGQIAECSHPEELSQLLEAGHYEDRPISIYCGFDPTAQSLHIGHLVLLKTLRLAQDSGLVPIVLFGGATGLIGDPTGRSDMRNMHTKETIAGYVENFKALTKRYFRDDVPNKVIFVNNLDWIGNITWLDFLRDIGVHFSVAKLLAADANRTRFEQGGLTFMEMGYQLLQAYDFLELSRKHNCLIQIGGNDQWSNVLAGADLIRRVDARKAFAVTRTLMADASGRKIGKTTGNALWLDRHMSSPFELFQYFRNIADADVISFYKVYSDLSLSEILTTVDALDVNLQKQNLAYEVTVLVHSKQDADNALQASKALFSGEGSLADAPTTTVTSHQVQAGMNLLDILVMVGLSTSKGEARKLIQGNGLAINGTKVNDANQVIDLSHFGEEGLILKKGKKDFHVLRIKG